MIDDSQLDMLARKITNESTRRPMLRILAVGVLRLLVGQPGRAAEAAACLNTGKACKRDSQCCSGRCRGPRQERTCRRPRKPLTGTCTADLDVCQTGIGADCNGDASGCRCFVTVSGRRLCRPGLVCAAPCTSNQDCAALTGPGSGCVPLAGQFCETTCGVAGEARCAAPCPVRQSRIARGGGQNQE